MEVKKNELVSKLGEELILDINKRINKILIVVLKNCGKLDIY